MKAESGARSAEPRAISRGCTCRISARKWTDDGHCETCNQKVREVQIQDRVRAVLVSDPRCLMWRNEIGQSSHLPDGRKRERPIRYGIANPGGADLIGIFAGRFVAVEIKTPVGRQRPEQAAFERHVSERGGVYAICRSEADARALLQQLQGAA